MTTVSFKLYLQFNTSSNKVVKSYYFSHLGKVKEESDKAKLTLRPVAEDLSKKLDKEVVFVPETRGEKLEAAIKDLKEGDVLLVENTRYEDLDGKKNLKMIQN